MSVLDNNIRELAYNYVFVISNNNNYNPQTVANKKVLNEIGKNQILNILSLPIDRFCNCYSPYLVRDFVYKNDYFTPRNMLLINPIYYIYYTYLVFRIFYQYMSVNGEVNFSSKNMKVFYSGLLDIRLSLKEIKKSGIYYCSYKKFQ
ncbi:hypothetical protein [Bacillus sp. B-jedd]|uniref:hypothetical protein n=1 Tax=Bacillus sp. B-jedd TaxID=1476857 RepID=UPI0005156C5D|nr:hypothetical protein [Bacillus sp. B-jedd]CEG26329.1 hypothetical protein BN1002_01172 [Bacillus sp. B-jedd]